MADDLISISCPGCNAVFELPIELGGEMGECTECGAIFEIPKIETVQSGNVQKTDTGSVKVSRASADGATNTVKLSRTSIGMVPDIKDSFQFNVVNKPTSTSTHARASIQQEPAPAQEEPGLPPPPQRQSSPTGTKKSFKAPPPSTSTATRTKTKAPSPKLPPRPKKKWWEFWK